MELKNKWILFKNLRIKIQKLLTPTSKFPFHFNIEIGCLISKGELKCVIYYNKERERKKKKNISPL